MWFKFRIDHREMEWQVSQTPFHCLEVRSCDHRFHVRARIREDGYALINGRLALSSIESPTVLGTEFPLGFPIDDPPLLSDQTGEFAKYGIIHTELVRSLVGRWAHRRRYRRKPCVNGIETIVTPAQENAPRSNGVLRRILKAIGFG